MLRVSSCASLLPTSFIHVIIKEANGTDELTRQTSGNKHGDVHRSCDVDVIWLFDV